jgi:hypothetical protein
LSARQYLNGSDVVAGRVGAAQGLSWTADEPFDPRALLRTGQAEGPLQVIRRFVQRSQFEITCREVRDHLGIGAGRQWSDKAIARTTPPRAGGVAVTVPSEG